MTYDLPSGSYQCPAHQTLKSASDWASSDFNQHTDCVDTHNCTTREVWSAEKKEYCCKHKGLCYVVSDSATTMSGYACGGDGSCKIVSDVKTSCDPNKDCGPPNYDCTVTDAGREGGVQDGGCLVCNYATYWPCKQVTVDKDGVSHPWCSCPKIPDPPADDGQCYHTGYISYNSIAKEACDKALKEGWGEDPVKECNKAENDALCTGFKSNGDVRDRYTPLELAKVWIAGTYGLKGASGSKQKDGGMASCVGAVSVSLGECQKGVLGEFGDTGIVKDMNGPGGCSNDKSIGVGVNAGLSGGMWQVSGPLAAGFSLPRTLSDKFTNPRLKGLDCAKYKDEKRVWGPNGDPVRSPLCQSRIAWGHAYHGCARAPHANDVKYCEDLAVGSYSTLADHQAQQDQVNMQPCWAGGLCVTGQGTPGNPDAKVYHWPDPSSPANGWTNGVGHYYHSCFIDDTMFPDAKVRTACKAGTDVYDGITKLWTNCNKPGL